mmetsp:Transcript_95986/g.250224  ORF Transcript_95986/g.250224 Transcript_95986/m.250224 type:complete len:120 (-) Transcript_95986:560-919(-)
MARCPQAGFASIAFASPSSAVAAAPAGEAGGADDGGATRAAGEGAAMGGEGAAEVGEVGEEDGSRAAPAAFRVAVVGFSARSPFCCSSMAKRFFQDPLYVNQSAIDGRPENAAQCCTVT